ncbi:MAG: UDP-N-acetylmuramate--L-alanine ligase [Clostridia bacterium]|nr:UDP-N-acetylmuramate--L-alanine ligase [Clostridia bacterium]
MSTPNTHLGAAEIGRLLAGAKSVYFIGVGGIHMSSLAHITQVRGYRVGGYDRAASALTRRLEDEGITIHYALDPAHLDGYDIVVYTVAISPDNPEYLRAKELGLPCISRADYLGYIMEAYRTRVGIAGMHGKSTCTSMCAHTFLAAGANPTILSGAELEEMGGAYHVGSEEHFLFEACEYMDSFLDFSPTVAVILNIEMDHTDYFTSMEQIRTSFGAFAAKTGPAGHVIANYDDADERAALEYCTSQIITFGISNPSTDYTATNVHYTAGRPEFDILCRGSFLCHVHLAVSGAHNIYNALAAAAAANFCGIPPEQIGSGLSTFSGAKRRMEYKGKLNGADVFDDYGHHPTEVRATLDGVSKLGYDRIWCVFQPHTYSRTAELFDDFAVSFENADHILFADIYRARGDEVNSTEVSSAKLAERIGDKASYYDSFEAIAEELRESVFDGDIVIIMGAGDIFRLYDHLPLEK